jgi:hypothetical protein
MPIDYKKYPPNWKTEIRPRILYRDQNQCKNCGKHNYIVGYYNIDGLWNPTSGNIYHDHIGTFGAESYKEAREVCDSCNEYGQFQGEHYIVIVLTIAHLDQDITNNDDNNLAALCQRCHFRHDAPYRLTNKLKRQGQLQLSL